MGNETSPPDNMSEIYFALHEPTRARIMELLLDDERGHMKPSIPAPAPRGLTAIRLVSEFNLSQPSVSRHLTTLYRAGLVARTTWGYYTIYRLNHAKTRQVGEALIAFGKRLVVSAALAEKAAARIAERAASGAEA